MKSPMREIVINTGPLIALVAATDSLAVLSALYGKVWVPHEVYCEIKAGGPAIPELEALDSASETVAICQSPLASVSKSLINQLDLGEASVIQTALELNLTTVAIDEKAGRALARLHSLKVTGSLGILLRAKNEGHITSLSHCVQKMRSYGIWISDSLADRVLAAAGES